LIELQAKRGHRKIQVEVEVAENPTLRELGGLNILLVGERDGRERFGHTT
jgi:hypothetical protein